MKIFTSAISASRSLALLGALSSLAVSACAATRTHSLPVQLVAGNVGSIASVRTFEQSGKLFVAGSARRTLTSGGHHVDIQLIGADGRVVAEETEALEPGHARGSRSRSGSGSFVTSFPLAATQPAVSVRVTFHSSGH